MATIWGATVRSSHKIQALADELALEVQEAAKNIDGLKGPTQAGALEEAVDRLGKVRGRPLVYKYLGSGLGNGAYVELEDGSVKIDLINGIGVHLMGHSHPVVVRASLKGALSDIVQHGHLQMNREYLQISEKLAQMASRKSRLKHVWLTTSGSMANENALKMVRQKNSPARKILSLERAFAGRTTMMAEITDNPNYRQGLPEYNEVLRVPAFKRTGSSPSGNVEEALKVLKEHTDKHKGDISAFVFEPVLGEGGYRVPTREYLLPILEHVKSEGIAVWADEVQTFLRTGQAFAFETLDFGSYVDVVTVAKTLQLGATLYTEDYNPKPGLIAGTFAASSQALHVGLAILEEMDKGYFGAGGRIAQINAAFAGGLQKLSEGSCQGLISDIESLGLMVAFTPYAGEKDEVSDFLKRLYDNGVITLSCGRDPYRARFLVPASITERQIQEALGVIEKTLLKK